jgi:phage host-nuclease inhibitor protein Gam
VTLREQRAKGTTTIKGQRLKRVAESVPVPADLHSAASSVARIGALQRDLSLADAAFAETVAKAKEAAEAAAGPLKAEIEALTRGVQIWAEAHRDELTQGGKTKTVTLSSGEVAWRTRPPSVRIRDAAAVLELLRAKQMGRFIREKQEVDKGAMLREPMVASLLPGVVIGSAGEEFVVTPAAAQLDGRAA